MNWGEKARILVFTLIALAGVSMSRGTVHEVGDVAGWNSERSVNYTDWAASRQFKIGDVLHFEYDPGFHNVVRVKRSDYRSCNAANPIATYSTGNDKIKLKKYGHYMFICGSPDHCTLTDQKVDVKVLLPKRY